MQPHDNPIESKSGKVRRDREVFAVQKDVQLLVYWKVLPVGGGPSLILKIFHQPVLRFDCFGRGEGHFHTFRMPWNEKHESRIYFHETDANAQIDRAIFELEQNLGYYLQINPDPAIREFKIDRGSLKAACDRARARMRDFVAVVPELKGLRTYDKDFQLDPNKRYLLSRPRGGLNDSLVQIEKSRLYAAKYDRVLVLDTSRGSFEGHFASLFCLSNDFGCEVIHWDEGMTAAFDEAASVKPIELTNRVSSYNARYVLSGNHRIDAETGCVLGFDHSRDHDAHVLVYDQGGGGPGAIQLLTRLTLRPDAANEIVNRLLTLGPIFDAVHIRHSDYQTEFETFLKGLRLVLKGRRVVMCSDSADAKLAAARILHPTTTLLSASDIPDTGGRPLHRDRGGGDDVRKTLLDMLTDFFALSLAENLFFTSLSSGNKNGMTFSGFSLLAAGLGQHPETNEHLLSSAKPQALKRLFKRARSKFNPVRWLHHLNYRRLNSAADRAARGDYWKSNSRILRPEEILPHYSDE